MNEREPSPLIKLPTTGGELELHWYNCLIRTFADETLDHIEMYEDDKTKGLRVGRAIIDIMFENDFSYRYDKYPDEATVEWFIASEVTLMEDELDDLSDM